MKEIGNIIGRPINEYPMLEKEVTKYNNAKSNICKDICKDDYKGKDIEYKGMLYAESKCLEICYSKVEEVEKVVAWQLAQLNSNSKDSPILSPLINIE